MINSQARYKGKPRVLRWRLLAGIAVLHVVALYGLSRLLAPDFTASIEEEVASVFTVTVARVPRPLALRRDRARARLAMAQAIRARERAQAAAMRVAGRATVSPCGPVFALARLIPGAISPRLKGDVRRVLAHR
jgi:hypothetical protein